MNLIDNGNGTLTDVNTGIVYYYNTTYSQWANLSGGAFASNQGAFPPVASTSAGAGGTLLGTTGVSSSSWLLIAALLVALLALK